MNLQLVTPERTVLTEEVVSLTCPTVDGEITILPGHAPIIATLTSGELIARSTNKHNDGSHNIHVAGGFVQVQNSGREIIILADAAEHFYEIDLERAKQAKTEAENILREQTLSDEEYAMAAVWLQRSLSRIHIARKHSQRKSRITSQGVLHD